MSNDIARGLTLLLIGTQAGYLIRMWQDSRQIEVTRWVFLGVPILIFLIHLWITKGK